MTVLPRCTRCGHDIAAHAMADAYTADLRPCPKFEEAYVPGRARMKRKRRHMKLARRRRRDA